ncbi:hypothetical protein IAT38_000460 [Cryptococcus sp. DSM 104549]
MTPAASLVNLLPTLALLGLALTGIEGAPSALAHGHAQRDHHRHLAQRQRLASGITKQQAKRKTIRRRADGSKCRIRDANNLVAGPAAGSDSAVTASSTAAATPAETAAETTSETGSASSTADVSFTDATAAPTTASSTSVAAESTTSASSGVTTGTIGSGGSVNVGSKFGAAWPNGNWAQASDPNYIGNYIGSKTAWYYTWSPFSVGSGDSLGLEFVPMYWGVKQQSDWYAQMASWPSTVKNALFFNEPNQVGQCDISAGDAVQYWMNDFLPLRAKGVRLGNAATTNAPSGLQWVQDFATACTNAGNSAADCTSDFIPVHWYDVTIEGFQSYIENFHQQTGQNLWVTEYACQNFNGGAQCTDQEIWNLHTTMAAWFDEQSYIERYSPFGMMADMQGVEQYNALMNPDGSITSLGAWYTNNS